MVHRGGDIDSENIYIEGDNLDALKILRETYLGKVKMIYIEMQIPVLIKELSAPQILKIA